MNHRFYNRGRAARHCCSLLITVLCLFFSGCASREPALSEAARSFQKEAQATIKRLTPAFTSLLARENTGTEEAAFEKIISDTGRGGSPVKFKVTVLDRNGIKLAGGFKDTGEVMNFSSYAAAQKVLQQGETAAEVLYLRGSQICLICAPLVHEGTVVGALALGVPEGDLKDHWQLTVKEFKEIDFN